VDQRIDVIAGQILTAHRLVAVGAFAALFDPGIEREHLDPRTVA
jgi:hypothetical protein